jgi:hypothetical protein
MADLFRRKTSAARAAKKPEEAPKKAAKRGNSKTAPEERFRMIEQAAYFHAEKAGFAGDPHSHWLAAEQEVDRILAKRK